MPSDGIIPDPAAWLEIMRTVRKVKNLRGRGINNAADTLSIDIPEVPTAIAIAMGLLPGTRPVRQVWLTQNGGADGAPGSGSSAGTPCSYTYDVFLDGAKTIPARDSTGTALTAVSPTQNRESASCTPATRGWLGTKPYGMGGGPDLWGIDELPLIVQCCANVQLKKCSDNTDAGIVTRVAYYHASGQTTGTFTIVMRSDGICVYVSGSSSADTDGTALQLGGYSDCAACANLQLVRCDTDAPAGVVTHAAYNTATGQSADITHTCLRSDDVCVYVGGTTANATDGTTLQTAGFTDCAGCAGRNPCDTTACTTAHPAGWIVAVTGFTSTEPCSGGGTADMTGLNVTQTCTAGGGQWTSANITISCAVISGVPHWTLGFYFYDGTTFGETLVGADLGVKTYTGCPNQNGATWMIQIQWSRGACSGTNNVTFTLTPHP